MMFSYAIKLIFAENRNKKAGRFRLVLLLFLFLYQMFGYGVLA